MATAPRIFEALGSLLGQHVEQLISIRSMFGEVRKVGMKIGCTLDCDVVEACPQLCRHDLGLVSELL
jgi:hypothetical protein